MSNSASAKEYHSFRSNIPQRKICINADHTWTLYDSGPKNVRCPLVCLPPASGQADVFYKQILSLSAIGYRVISVEYPVFWTLNDFCKGLLSLIDNLHLDKVHLFGASLGGYLAQKFAEHTHVTSRVHSLILCNSFIDTTVFRNTVSAHSFWMLPSLVLKKMVMGTFDKGYVDSRTADSIDFMVVSLDNLDQQELASRLTLNCVDDYVQPQMLRNIPVMIMDVNDESALSQPVKDEMYKCYPDAKRAQLKSGGNFPFLSRADEVNIFLQIHLQQFVGTKYSAMEPNNDIVKLYKQAQNPEGSSGEAAATASSANNVSCFDDL